MKKNLILFCIMLIVMAAGIKITWGYFGMHDYYVKITENGSIQAEPIGIGSYSYSLNAYDKKGNPLKVTFQTKVNLEMNTYLHLEIFKPKKDVINGSNTLEIVTASQVPKKAKAKLNIAQ